MTNILAKTNTGGDISKCSITIPYEAMDTVTEGQLAVVTQYNPTTLKKITAIGKITDLEPVNETEENNPRFFQSARAVGGDDNDIYSGGFKEKVQSTTYFVGTFVFLTVMEEDPINGVKNLGVLNQPLLGSEEITDLGDALSKMESVLNMDKYIEFGFIPDKFTNQSHKNKIARLNFENGAQHFAIVAETGGGKSTVAEEYLKTTMPTNINICAIDPKSELINETLAGGKNFISTAENSGRTVLVLSIFEDISFDLNQEDFSELCKIHKAFNDEIFPNIGNKSKFVAVFSERLIEKKSKTIQENGKLSEQDIIDILQEFQKEEIGSRVYTGISNKKPLETFQAKVEELSKDKYRVYCLTNNLNRVCNFFQQTENMFSVGQLCDEIVNKTSGNKTLTLLNTETEKEIPEFIKEKQMMFFVSKLTGGFKNLLSDSKLKKTEVLFFCDEANAFFPNGNLQNKYQKEATENLIELLNHWARSKGFGIGISNPDLSQIHDGIFDRLINKNLMLGFGIKHNLLKKIASRIKPEFLKEIENLPAPVVDENGLMKSCQFFLVGMKSVLDPNGQGSLVEFKFEDYL